MSEAAASSFITGSGDEIFSKILPKVEHVESELVIITCFWAKSTSRDRLVATLQKISSRALQQGKPKVKVFIGLSSVSLLQKLFHTNAVAGYTYPPSTWSQKLGLPAPSQLAGLDMTVKSVFIKPFSVMHPKFIIADRRRVWLPSCNISWEMWFEGCVELSGPIVARFVQFWQEFWLLRQADATMREAENGNNLPIEDSPEVQTRVESIFLPSPHHMNPRMRPLPWQQYPTPPPTPLNSFLLHLFSFATTSIYLQSPNLTSPPVLSALLRALERGISTHIVTSERLMILEQLVTAGTTTAHCMKRLVRRYKRCRTSSGVGDEETGLPKLGSLRVEYYHANKNNDSEREPAQSHLKLSIVDEHCVVLGSGNMDRASWYTSQELGVAFIDSSFANSVRSSIDSSLDGRKRLYFESSTAK